MELVVRDDGSTDATVSILEEFASRCGFPVRLTRNERNLHFTGNFLKAANECSGDHVVFCDQDDVWEDTKLEEIEAAIKLKQADLYLHEGVIIDEFGKSTGVRVPSREELTANPDSPPYNHAAKGFVMAVRKTVIDEILKHWDWDHYFEFREKYGAPLGHDLLIYVWCIDRKIEVIFKVLARYRVHQTNVTASRATAGGWMVRLARMANMVQFTEFNYERFADQWAAEVAFMDRMFPDKPLGIRRLSQYRQEVSGLWRARAGIHDQSATRRQRWIALGRFWRINRSVRAVSRFGAAAVAKDVLLTLLRSGARG